VIGVKPWLFGMLALAATMTAGCTPDCKAVVYKKVGAAGDTVPVPMTGRDCLVAVYGASDSVGPVPKK
jgi:hypothetical protein